MYLPEQWLRVAHESRLAAEQLYQNGNYRDCVSRCYYASFQTATSICVRHGDAEKFPANWNNPSHDQLPHLIQNNGKLASSDRKKVVKALSTLRQAREDADYRPGRTVDKVTALNCIRDMLTVRRILGAEDG